MVLMLLLTLIVVLQKTYVAERHSRALFHIMSVSKKKVEKLKFEPRLNHVSSVSRRSSVDQYRPDGPGHMTSAMIAEFEREHKKAHLNLISIDVSNIEMTDSRVSPLELDPGQLRCSSSEIVLDTLLRVEMADTSTHEQKTDTNENISKSDFYEPSTLPVSGSQLDIGLSLWKGTYNGMAIRVRQLEGAITRRKEQEVYKLMKQRVNMHYSLLIEFLGFSVQRQDEKDPLSPVVLNMIFRNLKYDLKSYACHVDKQIKQPHERERLKFLMLLDISRAVQFLHLAHDLAAGVLRPNNVLVDAGGAAKICDFLLTRSNIFQAEREDAIQYCDAFVAPEFIEIVDTFTAPKMIRCDDLKALKRGDIYSLSILMFTTYNPIAPPYSTVQSPEEISYGVKHNSLRPILQGLRGCASSIRILMRMCWDSDPAQRPNINTLLDKMFKFKESKNF
jgi:hypothetical protein